jgi:hypothetical protein
MANGETAPVSVGGLVALLVCFAGIALLVRGTYPRGIFDAVLGMDRWAIRVAAYATLMTDAYPPFRLDQGGREPLPTPRPDGPPASDTAGPTTQSPPVPVPRMIDRVAPHQRVARGTPVGDAQGNPRWSTPAYPDGARSS